MKDRGLSIAGVLALLLVLGLGAPALMAQDERPPGGEEEVLDPEAPITIDFVRKDIHTVMHFIALRSGLQIIVDSSVTVNLTVMFRRVVPREAVRSICQANKLDFIEDGPVIIIRARPQDLGLANVTRGDNQGRYNVNFEGHELVQAVMEVARETQTQVLVPSVPLEEVRRGDDDREGEIQTIQQRQISMYMREATPQQILERLARLGGLRVSQVDLDGEIGYEFEYRLRTRSLIGPDGPDRPVVDDEDIELLHRRWDLPGLNVQQLRNEIGNLISPFGKVLIDQTVNMVVVFDVEDRMERIATFLDPLRDAAMIRRAGEEDPIVVREYRLTRDVGEAGFLEQIRGALGDGGRAMPHGDRNSIIVWERESRIARLDKLMSVVDTSPDQVLITSKLIEITLDDYLGYGLQWFTEHGAQNLNDGRFVGSGQNQAGTVGGMFGQPTGFDPYFATFTNPRVDLRLELLANEGRVETLSQPTQMVSNRRTARINVGQEVPYLEGSSATGAATTVSVAFKEVSIAMDITPSVLGGGLIRLQVELAVREVIGNIAIEGNNTPILSVRESRTDVFIHDGETLMMGGLLRERERLDEQGLPFLKDIPFLGYLFKTKNRSRSKTDMLFFLRPQIVTAGKHAQISSEGYEIERDMRPLVYEEADARGATIRPNRYRTLGIAERPRHYNPQQRPTTPDEVDPGA